MRIKMEVEWMAVGINGKIEVSNKHVMGGCILFIKPSDVKWFYINEDNSSEPKKIQLGTTIEFDGDISHATRELHNVVIL